MRKLLLFIFLISFFTAKSQTILSDTVVGINCYHDGSINLVVDNINTHILNWYFLDSLLGWIDADTMSGFQDFSDTVFTTICGSFKVEIENSLGIFISSTQMDWVDCPLGIIPFHENVKCFGDSTGELKRIAHSGSFPYFYEWFMNGDSISSGNNDTLHDNLVMGNYQVIITDSIGCQDSISANIAEPNALIIDTMFGIDINCRGANTGSVMYMVKEGKRYTASEYYNYFLIVDNDTIAYSNSSGFSQNFSSVLNPYQITFDSLYAGEYSISIVDSFGCILNDSFVIVEPLPYSVFGSTTFPLICESDSGYFLIDSVLGGGNISFGFSYDTINGAHIDSIYVPSGTYNIYIEDLDFGCIDTVPVICNAQYEIIVYETIDHLFCYGDSSGLITIDSIVGGNAPYDIQWGGIDTTALHANVYSVLFVDAIGCVHEELFEVNQPDQFQANPLLVSPSCNGTSDGSIVINLSGGVGPLTYYWLNGTGTADSLYGLSAGVYSLVVIDSLLCADTIDVTLEEAELLEVTFTNYQNPLLCNGALTTVDVVINGGIGPYEIEWNDGDTILQRVLGAGSFSCEITDANGCIANETLVLIEPDSLQLNLSFTDPTCDQGGTAIVNISGGVQPIDIIWSIGDTTQSIDSLWGTTYWVIATDSCGNSDSSGFTLTPFTLETSLYYDNITHIGYIEVDNSSSGGPFSYEWTDILGNVISTNDSSETLCQATYFVTITDILAACSVTDTLDAIFYLPNGIVDLSTTTVLEDIDLWGFGPYAYLWDNGVILQHSNICPGSHWVEVTDVNGCMVREDFDIDPIIITLDPADAIIECNLENLDINLEAIAEGGTPPYTYEWSNGSTENPLNLALTPGNYSISVMDNNACIEDTVFVIATMSSECIPNVFTPNGDNVNDTWSLEDTFLYSDSEVKIYGRYGRLLFYSIGYSSPWDGKNKKDNDVPDGAYFYAIEIGHGFDPIKGTVTIIR